MKQSSAAFSKPLPQQPGRPQAQATRLYGIGYFILSVLILGPLLKPGYILALDMVFTPRLRMPAAVSNSWLFYAVLHWLNSVIAADWLQKLMLLAIFTLAGFGMFRLVRHVAKTSAKSKPAVVRLPHALAQSLPAGLAGLLYVVNPFVYDRLMTGQYGVLAGYAMLPWAARSLLCYLWRPGWRQGIAATIWLVIVSIVSIHSIGPMFVVAVLAFAWRFWQVRSDKTWDSQWQLVRAGALVAAAWLILSSYWLIPLAAGHGHTAQTIDSFTAGDRSTFATIGNGAAERIGNVLGLQGFWAESRVLYTLPQERSPIWGLLIVLLIIAVIGGMVSLWQQRQRSLLAFSLGCIIVGAVLAAGFGNGWLAGHLAVYAGYREPQKWAMLIAFGYAICFAASCQAIGGWLAKNASLPLTAPVAWICLALLPILITSPLFWGARHQLKAVAYPAGWYQVNHFLDSDPQTGKTLFLPWHLYIQLDFAGRIAGNPAPAFFDKPVIVSDDPEFGSAALAATDPDKRIIAEALLDGPQSDTRLADTLAQVGVKYIMVAHTSDYLRYGYLDRQTNLAKVADYGSIRLYRNNAYDTNSQGSSQTNVPATHTTAPATTTY